jgi:hypothetical protein
MQDKRFDFACLRFFHHRTWYREIWYKNEKHRRTQLYLKYYILASYCVSDIYLIPSAQEEIWLHHIFLVVYNTFRLIQPSSGISHSFCSPVFVCISIFPYVNTGQRRNINRRKSNTQWWFNEAKYVAKNNGMYGHPYFLLWWWNKINSYHLHHHRLDSPGWVMAFHRSLCHSSLLIGISLQSPDILENSIFPS